MKNKEEIERIEQLKKMTKESTHNWERVTDHRYRLSIGNFYFETCVGNRYITFEYHYKTIDINGVGTYGRNDKLEESLDFSIEMISNKYLKDSENVNKLKDTFSRTWSLGMKYQLGRNAMYFESFRDIENFLKVAKNNGQSYTTKVYYIVGGEREDYLGKYNVEFDGYEVASITYEKFII